mgnify:CR=1 FL=1
MHQTIINLDSIKKELELKMIKLPSIIAVSKTFPISKILPLIDYGHIHFGENKVQEAVEKWTDIKQKYNKVKLHMIGKLQTNKVKFVIPLFDYIHSLDNEKLALKLSEEQKKYEKKPKIFIQINVANENQKSGINKEILGDFYHYCKNLNLDIVGLMCLPPNDKNPTIFFKEMQNLSKSLNLNELSMGMTADYIEAAKNSSTFLRIGSKIFGERF